MTNNKILNNRYQVQQELGRQTGRRTLLATDLQTQQQVVVKLLLLGKDFEWQDLKLFQREAETLKNLNHPEIPRYLDYFEFDTPDDKGFGLVQTYVEAKSLEQHLQAGRRFSETEVKELAQKILEILSYLHQQQPLVIHRDIKPSNILLTNRSGNSVGQVYLVDFGSVTNIAAQEGGTITVVGTYGYMPPEQFGGRTKPASDLYSLGATLIYLVTGMHPTELPQKDLQIQFRHITNLSREFSDWLEWMTEPSLEKRFASVEIAISNIENPPIRENAIQKLNKKSNKIPKTKIKLIKTCEQIEIILPPKGLGIALVALISCVTPFALGFNLGSFNITSMHPAISGNIFLLLLQGCAIAFLIYLILSSYYKRLHIKIDREKITINHKLFGLKWNFGKPTPISQVSRIDFAQSATDIILTPNLKIIANDFYHFNFNFDAHTNLTDEERKWLVKELSDWLEVPVNTYKYPPEYLQHDGDIDLNKLSR
jgi:serine/threonine protein kinase